MRVALISPYSNITSFGVRLLSSCLKGAGHQVKLVFMSAYSRAHHLREFAERPYSESGLASLSELCSDCDLVGISLMTNFHAAAVQMTEAIRERRTGVPILWGGVHPTICPGESLEHADMVCIGEGEEALLELVDRLERGKGADQVRNVWLRRDGRVQKNPIRPWLHDLGSLPLPDSDTGSHFAITPDGSKVVPMDAALTRHHLLSHAGRPGMATYSVMTTRGCPRNCTYCANNALRRTIGPEGYCRAAPIDWVMGDLRAGVAAYAAEYVVFDDDCLLCRPLPELQDLGRRYREQIGLPFRAMAIPPSVSEAKLDCLVEAGLSEVQIGVQSASVETLRLYNRGWGHPATVRKAAGLLSRHAGRLMPTWDFILDNPHEDGGDVVSSAWLIRDLPRPARFQLFSLMAYPGTELAAAREAGDQMNSEVLERICRSHYHDTWPTYVNFLCSLATRRPPRWLFGVLTSRAVRFACERRWFQHLYTRLRRLRRRAPRTEPGPPEGRPARLPASTAGPSDGDPPPIGIRGGGSSP